MLFDLNIRLPPPKMIFYLERCLNVAETVDGIVSAIWRIQIEPISEPGPFTMNITCKDEILILNDVMFGDVWLCSGASNMGIPLWEVNISYVVLREGLSQQNARNAFWVQNKMK